MAAVIGKVGTPCLVEADVPIMLFGSSVGLAFKIVGRFLTRKIHQGENFAATVA
jgi:hypothetical protein